MLPSLAGFQSYRKGLVSEVRHGLVICQLFLFCHIDIE